MSPSLVLTLLFSINILNYVDRQALYAVLPLIKSDLVLSDTQLGMLASAFMVVYMCAAPLIAYISDRTSRKGWIGGGVLAWSLATVFTGFSRGYSQLFTTRATVGIGESCFGSISPSFVAENFPFNFQGRVLAIFSMAIPAGSALGYVVGGFLGHHFGWRSVFYWTGLAGVPLGIAALFLKDPRKQLAPPPVSSPAEGGGIKIVSKRSMTIKFPLPTGGEGRGNHGSGSPLGWSVEGVPGQGEGDHPNLGTYLNLLKNKTFLIDTLAMAASTFALGGLAVWMPTYFHRQWGLNVSQAGILFGGVTVVSGIAGSLTGGWLADHLLERTRNAYFLVSGIGLIFSLPFGVLTLMGSKLTVSFVALGIAEYLIFLNTGPLTAVITSVVSLPGRTMAFALNIFAIHALGDALSPTLIGHISDLSGLKNALLLTLVFLGAAGTLCFWGTKFYENDCVQQT